MSRITLKDAVSLYSQEKGAPSNSYDWYRRSAQRHGTVHVGDVKIQVHKEGGIWYIDNTMLARAIKNHREKIRHIEQTTRDYEKGIIHGKNGETIRTTWGGYEIRDKFRVVWSDIARSRQRSYGTWYCNSCDTAAGTKHEKPECHLCSDWNGCGKDCTLSEVYCKKCGYRLTI
jgi:hypothetical protein